MIDIDQLLPEVTQIICQAGDILMDYFHGKKSNSISVKGSGDPGNIVTQADLTSEKFLLSKLKKLFPQAGFCAEESGKSGEGDYRWVIDPLDGTGNFAHGLDYFCISVALTYHDKPVLGFVYRPVTKELFWAQAGAGAFCNGVRLHVSSIKNQEKAFVGLCLPYGDERLEAGLENLTAIAQTVAGVRKFGAAALDQAHVAAGRLDAVLFEDLGWWDIAAGMLLVTEAGGIVTDYEGNEIGPDYRSFLASNGLLQDQLRGLI